MFEDTKGSEIKAGDIIWFIQSGCELILKVEIENDYVWIDSLMFGESEIDSFFLKLESIFKVLRA